MVGGAIFATPVSLVTYGSILFIMRIRAKRRSRLAKTALSDRAWEQP